MSQRNLPAFTAEVVAQENCAQEDCGETMMPASKVIKIKKAEYLGELMWGDFDLIFPIMDLFQNSISVRWTLIAKGDLLSRHQEISESELFRCHLCCEIRCLDKA